MTKQEYFNSFYNLYVEQKILLSNTQLIFFQDIYPQLSREEAIFFDNSAKRIQQELEEDLRLLKESEETKTKAEQNFLEAVKLQEDLKVANEKLNLQNQEIIEKLKVEQEFNKDFERIKAQNKLAAKFLYVVTFLIVCILAMTTFSIFNINEEAISSVEKTNNIVLLTSKGIEILKDLLLLLIGVLSTIFAQMFNVPREQKKRAIRT